MGLVEPVTGELLYLVKDLVGDVLADAPVLLGAAHEFLALGQKHLFLLLAHGAPHVVGFGGRVPRDVGQDADNLLLVHDDAVGLSENRLQFGVDVLNGDAPMPALGEIPDELHRPRTIQRHDRHHVLVALGLEAAQHLAHAFAFHLEQARYVPAGQEFVDVGVVQGDVAQVQVHAVVLADEIARPPHDGEGRQSEEVHLEQADLLQGFHLVLGYHAALALGGAVQGHVLHQRLVGDDDARGVGGGVGGHALQSARGIYQRLEIGRVLVLVQRLEFGYRLQTAINGYLGAGGNQFRHPIHFGQGQVQHAPRAADGRLGAQRAEGDDLRHLVGPVLVNGVLNHLIPTVVGEVQVHIGHGNAPGVQEALKDEFLRQGVYIRQAQTVGDNAPGGGPPDVPPDVPTARVPHQVPHDEEVGVKPHVVDDAQFVLHPLAHVLGHPRVAFGQPLCHQFRQIGLRREAIGHLEGGQVVVPELKGNVAGFGDAQGVVQRLGPLGEQGGHLIAVLQIETVVPHVHVVGVCHDRVGLEAQEDFLRVGVAGVDVVHVVGGDQRNLQVAGDVHQSAVDVGEFGEALVILQFQVEAIGAEYVAIPGGGFPGAVQQAILNKPRDFAGAARAERDKPLGVGREVLLVNAGLVVEPFQLGGGGDFQQVLVALIIAGQEHQMVGPLVFAPRAGMHGVGREVNLAAEDGLHAGGVAFFVELNDAEQCAVVGERHGGHAQFRRALGERIHFGKPVKEGVFAVHVKMNEGTHRLTALQTLWPIIQRRVKAGNPRNLRIRFQSLLVFVIARARSARSNPWGVGLLRFARNDTRGECAYGSPTQDETESIRAIRGCNPQMLRLRLMMTGKG